MEKQAETKFSFTKKQVQTVLLGRYVYRTLRALIVYLLLAGAVSLILAVFDHDPLHICLTVLTATLAAVLLVYLYCFIVTLTKKFRIKQETLIGKEHGRIKFNIFRRFYPSPHKFYFYPHIVHRVAFGLHYGWSPACAMDHDKVYDTSTEGDDFYVVYMGFTAVEVYNMKYFTLQEE